MDQPTDTPASNVTPARSKTGIWVVLVMLGCGVVGGVVSTSYWASRGQGPQSERQGGEGWDRDQVQAELEEIQEFFSQSMSNGGSITLVQDRAVDLVDRYPEFAGGRTLLAQVYLFQEQFEKGYEQLSQSLGLDGQQPEVQLLAGTAAMSLGRVDRAVHHYSQAVGLDTGNARYRLHLAQAYIKQGRHDLARRDLLMVIQADSSRHEAYASLADLYATQNKLVLALNMITQAIQRTPIAQGDKRAIYVRRKADLLRRDNRPDEALMVLQGLGSLALTDLGVMREMALCWAMMGRPGEAALMYEDALKANPLRWEYAAGAAQWFLKAGDDQAARKHLETARNINPRSEEVEQLEAQLQARRSASTFKPRSQ